MPRNHFRVTYEIVTPESAAIGDAEERGFVSESCDLREGFDLIGNYAIEADCSPISLTHPPRWITNYEYGHGTRDYFEQGAEESRSLHFPDNITPASALRICRLCGVR